MPDKIQKSCTIRGVDYQLSMNFCKSSTEKDVFVLDALNQMTMHTWRGIFNSDTVARLTSQVGSVKAFPAFMAMVKAAILRSSKSVNLDIFTAEILAKKSGNSHAHSSKLHPEADPRRLYLILTHRTEFEDSSYPLPLDYREPTLSRSSKRRIFPDLAVACSTEEFDNQKIAFAEFQIEVKHLRKENQQLRGVLIEERSSRKEFESHLCKERDRLQRHLELQLSTERTNFQKEFQHISRKSKMLTNNLNLAKRETESLRIQVRRLQAENSVYKRDLTIRPCPKAVSHRQISLAKHSSGTSLKSRLNLRDLKDRSSLKSKAAGDWGHLDRSVSPEYHPSNLCAEHNFCQASKNTSRQKGLQRYHSADYLEHHSPYLYPESHHIERSRSYSPQCIHRKPAFSIIKTLCPSESLFSASRSSSPDPIRRSASKGFIRDSRHSRSIHQARRTSRGASIVSSVSSGSIHTGGERSARKNEMYGVSRSASPHSPTRSPLRGYRGRKESLIPKKRVTSPSPYVRGGSGDRSLGRIRELDDRFLPKDQDAEVKLAGKFVSRSASPAALLVQKYKEGTMEIFPGDAPNLKRRTSLNGAKFRDLLTRLQGLSEEFPDTPR